MASFFPAIGSSFQELATGQIFEVISVDEENDSMEVQYQDGDIAEFDKDSWSHHDVIMASPHTYGRDHFGDDSPFERDEPQHYYGNPLEDIEPDSFGGFDDYY